jgi:hypothetical protein
MNGDPDDRIVYLYRDNDWNDTMDVAYYDASSEELHPLAHGDNPYFSPQISVLNTGSFIITSGEADKFFFYHTETETPWEPAAVLGGNGKGLSDADIQIQIPSMTDKNDPACTSFLISIWKINFMFLHLPGRRKHRHEPLHRPLRLK